MSDRKCFYWKPRKIYHEMLLSESYASHPRHPFVASRVHCIIIMHYAAGSDSALVSTSVSTKVTDGSHWDLHSIGNQVEWCKTASKDKKKVGDSPIDVSLSSCSIAAIGGSNGDASDPNLFQQQLSITISRSNFVSRSCCEENPETERFSCHQTAPSIALATS